MAAGLVLQYVLVAIAVALSAWFVARRQFPDASRRLRLALALPLVRAGRPGWAQGLGRWIAPVPAKGASACGGCDDCGSKPR